MPAIRKHPPEDARERIAELAIKGESTTGLARHFKVSRQLVGRWFEDHQDLEEIYQQGLDSYRQWIEEEIVRLTLAGKIPAGLIYLLKAKFKMWDQPNNKPDPASIAIQVNPVMVVRYHGSDEEWQARVIEQQRKSIEENIPTPQQIVQSSFIKAPMPELAAPAESPTLELAAPSWKGNS